MDFQSRISHVFTCIYNEVHKDPRARCTAPSCPMDFLADVGKVTYAQPSSVSLSLTVNREICASLHWHLLEVRHAWALTSYTFFQEKMLTVNPLHCKTFLTLAEKQHKDDWVYVCDPYR